MENIFFWPSNSFFFNLTVFTVEIKQKLYFFSQSFAFACFCLRLCLCFSFFVKLPHPNEIWEQWILKSNKFTVNYCKICKFVPKFTIMQDFYVFITFCCMFFWAPLTFEHYFLVCWMWRWLVFMHSFFGKHYTGTSSYFLILICLKLLSMFTRIFL